MMGGNAIQLKRDTRTEDFGGEHVLPVVPVVGSELKTPSKKPKMISTIPCARTTWAAVTRSWTGKLNKCQELWAGLNISPTLGYPYSLTTIICIYLIIGYIKPICNISYNLFVMERIFGTTKTGCVNLYPEREPNCLKKLSIWSVSPQAIHATFHLFWKKSLPFNL